jgi:rRNA maturation protein Nop10
MKLLDIINEDFTPEQLKELKEAKGVYTVLKRGAFIFYNTYNKKEYKVKYELGEPTFNWDPPRFTHTEHYNKFRIIIKDITVYITDQDLYDSIITNPSRMKNVYGQLVHNYMGPKITKRFENHKVMPYLGQVVVDFILVQPDEPEQINEELTDKDRKKCETLFNLYKSGMVTVDDEKYKYYLKDEHQIITVPSNSHPIIEIIGRFDNSIRVYEILDNGHLTLLDYELNNSLYSKIKAKVKKRFSNYNVHLSL